MRKMFSIKWNCQYKDGSKDVKEFIVKDTCKGNAIKQVKKKLSADKNYTFGYLVSEEEVKGETK